MAERYPDDLDAATLYAEALFLLEPRRGTRDLNDANVKRLHGVLEKVLAADIRHPGACHLYVHATESTVRPEKAEACAEYLGNAIPGASHINHMPSHTWNEIGRWGDSVRANLQAWHSDLKAEFGKGLAIYPSHNLHMLLFAASMDGQGAIAIQAGKDYAKLTGDTMYHVLTLLRFGRFDEIAALTERPEREISGGLWDFAQGYARLRDGEPDFRSRPSRTRAPHGGDVGAAAAVSPWKGHPGHCRRDPGRRDPPRRGGPGEQHPVVRGGGRPGRRADVRRARAAAVRRAPLAGRGVDRGGAATRRPSRCTARNWTTTRTTAGRSSG